MAHINRKYIDKHWMVFVLRGGLAVVFGLYTLFTGAESLSAVVSIISIFLLVMGVVDTVSALYASVKKRGWITSVVDALIDIAGGVTLLFFTNTNLMATAITLAVYTFVSGIVDIFHGFVSTVDPTDRFIRLLAGVLGAIIGFVILNSWHFEVSTFIRFFGAYALVVGTTSLIYGVHNRSQKVEDKIARKEARRKKTRK